MPEITKTRRHNLEPPSDQMTFQRLMEFCHSYGVGNRLDESNTPLPWNRTDWEDACFDASIQLSYNTFQGWRNDGRRPKNDKTLDRFCRIIAPSTKALRGEWKHKLSASLSDARADVVEAAPPVESPQQPALARAFKPGMILALLVLVAVAALAVWPRAGNAPPLQIIATQVHRVTPPGYVSGVRAHDTDAMAFLISHRDAAPSIFFPEWQGRAHTSAVQSAHKDLGKLGAMFGSLIETLNEISDATYFSADQKATLANMGIPFASVQMMQVNPSFKSYILGAQVEDARRAHDIIEKILAAFAAPVGCSYAVQMRIENRSERDVVIQAAAFKFNDTAITPAILGPAHFKGALSEVPTTQPFVDNLRIPAGEIVLRTAFLDLEAATETCGFPNPINLTLLGEKNEVFSSAYAVTFVLDQASIRE